MPRKEPKLKSITRRHWTDHYGDSGTGLRIDCPTHHCVGAIITYRKPTPQGLLLGRCDICGRLHRLLLHGWASPPPPLRDHTPTDPTDTRGT